MNKHPGYRVLDCINIFSETYSIPPRDPEEPMSTNCVKTNDIDVFDECIGGTWHKVTKQKYECVDSDGERYDLWRNLSSYDTRVPCNAPPLDGDPT